MRSPGRPKSARHVQQQQFWVNIARGLSSEDAAVRIAVSSAVGSRWFRDSGGLRSISLTPMSGRYLNFPERNEISILSADRRYHDCAARPWNDP